MLDTNTIHNLLNILIATGCTKTVAGGLECSQFWINPTYTAAIIAVPVASKKRSSISSAMASSA